MRTFSDLIDEFGVADLAKILKVDESHVRTMKARDSVPPEYWGQIIEEAPKHRVRGVSWKTLKALRDSRFPTREKGAA